MLLSRLIRKLFLWLNFSFTFTFSPKPKTWINSSQHSQHCFNVQGTETGELHHHKYFMERVFITSHFIDENASKRKRNKLKLQSVNWRWWWGHHWRVFEFHQIQCSWDFDRILSDFVLWIMYLIFIWHCPRNWDIFQLKKQIYAIELFWMHIRRPLKL